MVDFCNEIDFMGAGRWDGVRINVFHTAFWHLYITEFTFFTFFCQKILKRAFLHRIFAVRFEKVALKNFV